MPRKKPSKRQLRRVALPLAIIVFVAVVFSIRNIRAIVGVKPGAAYTIDSLIVTITATVCLSLVAACMVIIGFGELYKYMYRTLSGIFEPSDDADRGLFDFLESYTKPKSKKPTSIAKRGDDLSSVARERYGSHVYAKLLDTNNTVGNQERPRDGQVKLPYLKTILANVGLTKNHEAEVTLLLTAKRRFLALEKQLANPTRAEKDDGLIMPARIRQKLDQVANLIDQARLGFASVTDPEQTPTRLVSHLRRLSDDLRKLSTAPDGTSGYPVEIIHRRFVDAMLSAIEWARNGYKE